MQIKEKISINQFSILIIMYSIGASTLITPTFVTNDAKQDAWLSILFTTGFSVGLVLLYGTLARRYPTLTLAEYTENILGKWLGKFMSLLYFIFFLLLTAGLLRIIGDLLTTQILQETPIQAIVILFLLTVIMGVRLGLETIARTSEMVFPHVLLFFLLLILLLTPQIEFQNISPFLENGLNPVLLGAFRTLGNPVLDFVTFLMIVPNVSTPEKIGKAWLISVIIGGSLITLVTLLSILVLGPDLTSIFHYPTFELAQKINIANFIQRIEIISGAIIFISIFIKVTICFYAMVLSMAQVMKLNHYKILTFPLGLIVSVLSISYVPNIVYFNTFMAYAWTPFSLVFGLIFPLLLLVVDSIKSRLLKRNHNPF